MKFSIKRLLKIPIFPPVNFYSSVLGYNFRTNFRAVTETATVRIRKLSSSKNFLIHWQDHENALYCISKMRPIFIISNQFFLRLARS